MTVLETIIARQSTRDWTEEKVSDEILAQLLEAGRRSPSPLNSQPWHFIVVRNKDAIKKIMGYAHHGAFLSHADVVVVVTVEKKAKIDQWLFEHEQHLYSGACALYNMWLASCELGLGSCWVTLDEQKVEEFLSIPSDQKIIGSLATGYSKEGYHREAPRKELSEIVSYERYGKTTE